MTSTNSYLKKYVFGKIIDSKIKDDPKAVKALLAYYTKNVSGMNSYKDQINVLERYAGICNSQSQEEYRYIYNIWDNKGQKAQKLNTIIDLMYFHVVKKKLKLESGDGRVFWLHQLNDCLDDKYFLKIIDLLKSVLTNDLKLSKSVHNKIDNYKLMQILRKLPKPKEDKKTPIPKKVEDKPVKPKKIEIKYELFYNIYKVESHVKKGKIITKHNKGYRTYLFVDDRLRDFSIFDHTYTAREIAEKLLKYANEQDHMMKYNYRNKINWYTSDDLLKVMSKFKPGEKDKYPIDDDLLLDQKNEKNHKTDFDLDLPKPKKSPARKKSPAPKKYQARDKEIIEIDLVPEKQKLFSEWYEFILPLAHSPDLLRENEDDYINMCEKFLEKGKGNLIDGNMRKITNDVIDHAKKLKASRAKIQKEYDAKQLKEKAKPKKTIAPKKHLKKNEDNQNIGKAKMNSEDKQKKQESPWIKHVKQYMIDNNLSYRDALKKAGDTYNKIEKKTQSKQKKEKKKTDGYNCEFCDYKTTDKSNFNRHMAVKHTDRERVLKDLMSARGLVKKYTRGLKSKNEDIRNESRIIINKALESQKVAQNILKKLESGELKKTNTVKKKPMIILSKKIPKYVDELIERINKGYEDSNNEELGLTRSMIIGFKKTDDDIIMKVKNLEVDDGEKIDNIELEYDEKLNGYDVGLMQDEDIKGEIQSLEYDTFYIY